MPPKAAPNVNLDALPTIPDKVVDQIRKGRDVPIEAISPIAAEMAARRREDAKRPVYAADLVPISKDEAQRRRTFTGDALPAMPSVRRVIPQPFQRARIEINHHGKTWQDVRAEVIEPGDMVVSVGRVIHVEKVPVYKRKGELLGLGVADPDTLVACRVDLVLTNAIGDEFTVDSRAEVRAFRKAQDAAASGADGP